MEFRHTQTVQQQIIENDEPYDPNEAQTKAATAGTPESGVLSSLRGAMPAITKANKKFIYIATAIIFLIIAVALIQVVTPKKEKPMSENERHPETTSHQKANLPDTVNNLPGSYKATPENTAASAAPGTTAGLPSSGPSVVPKLGPPLPGGIVPPPGAVTPEAARAAGLQPLPAPLQTTPDQTTQTMSPEEGKRAAARERRQKVLQTAYKSPIAVKLDSDNGTKGFLPGSSPSPATNADPSGMLKNILAASTSPAAAQAAQAQDQNMQDQKKGFLKEKPDKGTYVNDIIQPPLSPYEIKAGTIIPIVMIFGINSDLPGEIVAQVRENVYDTATGRYLLIPQGAKVKGAYDSHITYAQDGVLVIWQRLIFPNANSINLENMPGADLSGYAGYRDQVNNHWGRIAGSAILSTVFGVGAKYAAGQPTGTLSADSNLSFKQAAGQGAGEQIQNVGQKITDRSMNMQPTIEIRMGQRYNILVNKDLILKPYSKNL